MSLDIETPKLRFFIWIAKNIPIKHRSPQEVFGCLGFILLMSYVYHMILWGCNLRHSFKHRNLRFGRTGASNISKTYQSNTKNLRILDVPSLDIPEHTTLLEFILVLFVLPGFFVRYRDWRPCKCRTLLQSTSTILFIRSRRIIELTLVLAHIFSEVL